MRFPLKLNASRIPRWLSGLVPSVSDPRAIIDSQGNSRSFEEGIGAIRIDSTWKTTHANRHPITDQIIREHLCGASGARVLDIGSSSGRTSLDLIDALGRNFSTYYVTDLYFTIPCRVVGGVTYFYHPTTKTCIMRSDGLWIAYDARDGEFAPLGALARKMLARAPSFDAGGVLPISMVHPLLRARLATDPRVVVEEFNVFDPWPHAPVDLIKVANVLNRGYFATAELQRAMRNLRRILSPDGLLLVTDNADVERVSVFRAAGAESLQCVRNVNSGAGIRGSL